jgi:hypothetical protein
MLPSATTFFQDLLFAIRFSTIDFKSSGTFDLYLFRTTNSPNHLGASVRLPFETAMPIS